MLYSRSIQSPQVTDFAALFSVLFSVWSPFLFLIAIQVTVGLVQWKTYKRKGPKEPRLVARKQVGQKMTISITVDKDSEAETVLEKAVEAFKRIETALESIKMFHLLYPDLQNEVNFLPGSQEPFTPRKYVELPGTYFSKVRVYLVTADDWLGELCSVH